MKVTDLKIGDTVEFHGYGAVVTVGEVNMIAIDEVLIGDMLIPIDDVIRIVDKPAEKDEMTKPLLADAQVGDVYETREGKRIKLKSINDGLWTRYPYTFNDQISRDIYGRAYLDAEHGRDVVSLFSFAVPESEKAAKITSHTRPNPLDDPAVSAHFVAPLKGDIIVHYSVSKSPESAAIEYIRLAERSITRIETLSKEHIESLLNLCEAREALDSVLIKRTITDNEER